MRVEVDSSEAHGLSMPRRFRLDGRVVKVVKVLDQWFGTDYRYCKVTGSDRALYPAARREPIRVESHDVRKPESLDSRRHNPVQTDNRLKTHRLMAAQPRNGDLTAVRSPEAGVWAPKRNSFSLGSIQYRKLLRKLTAHNGPR